MTGEASSVNLDRSVVRRKAMDFLARREYSCGELTQKLQARWPDYSALIEAVVTELQRDGLLSDERFIDMFIHASARKGRGPLRIVTELRQKGIDELIAKRSVNESEIDWFEAAKQVRQRKFGEGGDVVSDFNEKARQMRFLQYRGFSQDQITASFEE